MNTVNVSNKGSKFAKFIETTKCFSRMKIQNKANPISKVNPTNSNCFFLFSPSQTLMGCQLHVALAKTPPKKPTRLVSPLPSYSSVPANRRTPSTISATAITQKQISESTSVSFKTLGACKLGISRYPDFEYNALGGTGAGKCTESMADKDEVSVNFNVATLYIPPLMGATTKFLGLPLPPFLKIDIAPEILKGIINQKSGEVNLLFRAKFWFSVGSMYRAPPLLVETVLTSEESTGQLRSGKGERLNEEGNCKLVGVATIAPIDDFLMDSFLSLPTECLANLNATISFSTT